MGLLTQLVEMSNRYGSDADYVLAGGGNTSFKQDGILYVKASGTQLATVGEEGFVAMDIAKLNAVLDKQYPDDAREREAAALADMAAAVRPGQQTGAPSVECLLHGILPYRYILHLHPAIVNGMTCGRDGEAVCAKLFSDAAWIGATKPGYALGKACKQVFDTYAARNGAAPKLAFMQNHGMIAAADTVDELDTMMTRVIRTLEGVVKQKADFTPVPPPESAQNIAPALRMLYANEVRRAVAVFCTNTQVASLVKNADAAADVMMPFTPDHILYCNGRPLFLCAEEDAGKAFRTYVKKNGLAPKIVLVEGIGFFALGASRKEADAACQLFLDAVKIAVYAQSFGDPRSLTEGFTDDILHWGAETGHGRIAPDVNGRRMEGKICIVTGGAQGFGEGIARGIAAQGGYVVVADLNGAGAQRLAGELEGQYGKGTAIGVQANVADEQSVAAMVREAVLQYGGLDVMVSCAGILIAGDLDSMTVDKFEKVGKVNYTGYFLCAKYASVPMKIQRQYAAGYTADIIEINSKSGIEGSKANFAYAGSKFGGVGLTQSFALELAPFGIKVNAICPGNLLDGPLWTDPEKGLFKQYFEAGKVPGAKSAEDVRRYYEGKVPLNRGCTTEDVVVALLYIVEQQYETGQAVPVTGGQVMLN